MRSNCFVQGWCGRIDSWDEGESCVVGFYVDHLEFIDRGCEHGEEAKMEESEVGCDEVVFVNGGGSSASAMSSSATLGSALARASMAVNL